MSCLFLRSIGDAASKGRADSACKENFHCDLGALDHSPIFVLFLKEVHFFLYPCGSSPY